MHKKEILFIRMGSFSQINNNVQNFLEREFKEHSVTVFNVKQSDLNFIQLLINVYYFIIEYGFDLIRGKRNPKDLLLWFFSTSYASQQLTRKIRTINKGENYLFTIQTQSLFNGKLKNIPHFVYTDHTTQTNKLYPDIDPKQYMKSNRYIQKAETRIYQEASMIFTFGSKITWSLINHYKIPEKKVMTVFAGSNVADQSSDNPEKYYRKNILFVGVEWERKGGPVLLRIFEKVLSVHPDASLTIIGCSPNVSLPNCQVLGKIPVEKVADYYNNASVFCMPTLREPFGIVFIEAMSYKLPIVANNVGSLPDIVENGYNGYLVNNDVEQYTNAIIQLFADPEKCRQLGENGYALTRSKFSWEIVGRKIKEAVIPFLKESN